MKVYRERALQALSGRWGTAIGVTLVYGVVVSAVSQFYGIGTVFVGFPLLVGLTYYFLNLSLGGDSFDDLFQGFRENYIENAFTIFLKNVYVFLWTLLFIIPGIVKSFSYAFVPYILADDKYSLTYNDAISESNFLMDGHKMELFMLYLSFIGWFLLCIPTFGIGFIWLQPYITASVTEFYIDVKEREERKTQSGPFDSPQPKKESFTEKESEKDEWEF